MISVELLEMKEEKKYKPSIRNIFNFKSELSMPLS